MLRVGIVGLGKMGASHFAIANAHPGIEVVGVCDSMGYVLDVLTKYTGTPSFRDFDQMLVEAKLDAVIIATPSNSHGPLVEKALEHGLHTFCEKPFSLDPATSARLAAMAADRRLANQVGYHYRFVATFQEVKRLLDSGAIGRVSHVLAEAYGPVVLRPKGSTWRTRSRQGGGCLYDYAAHPINLLNWYFGDSTSASGSVVGKIFSRDTDDEVYSTLFFQNGPSAQLSVNWSDESYRKMSTKISVWGENGRIIADRQECQTYLRSAQTALFGYTSGWNIRYTTDLTPEVWFYVRGEEYSAQIDDFVSVVGGGSGNGCSFADAAQTDRTIAQIISDASADYTVGTTGIRRKRRLFGLKRPA